MRRYALRDAQWDRIAPILPSKPGDVGVTAKDNRLFVEAVLYRYRAGIPWRDLTERFGDFRVIHTRHDPLSGHSFGIPCRAVDATIIRAHQHAAGAKGETKPPNA